MFSSIVERSLGQELFEPGVLVFQRLQPTRAEPSDRHTGPSLVEGRTADVVFAIQVDRPIESWGSSCCLCSC